MKPGDETTTLKCTCGGELFVPVFKLRWKENTGVTTSPAGHKCEACGETADNASLIRREQLRIKRMEAAAAQAEVDELEGPKPRNTVGLRG